MSCPMTPISSALREKLEGLVKKWRATAATWESQLDRGCHHGSPVGYGKGTIRNWINWMRSMADELESTLLSGVVLREEAQTEQKEAEKDTRVENHQLRHPADNPTAVGNETIRGAARANRP